MYCYGMDREGFATDDLKNRNQYQITNDISEVEFDKYTDMTHYVILLVMLIYYKHIKKHTSIEERTILQ